MVEKHANTWKPKVAGILSIVAGAFTAYYRTFGSFANHWHIYQAFTSVIGLIAIAGGVFALKRQKWPLALIGAICAIYPPHPWQDFSWTPIVGVIAVVLLLKSKSEFTASRKQKAM
jgi:hypothetical protein